MEPNSFKEFKTIIGRSAGTMPMTSNLYQVNLSAPPIFRKGGSGIYDPVKEIEAERTIDYYANSITLPSRAVTTGELNNVGQIEDLQQDRLHQRLIYNLYLQKTRDIDISLNNG